MALIKKSDIIEKLLEDCDPQVREFMLSESATPRYSGGPMQKVWEMIDSPESVILQWQLLREQRRG